MAVPWTPEQSLVWLTRQRKNPDKNYKNLCAHLVSRAAGYDGAGHASASNWGRSLPGKLRHGGTPPRGTVVFWVTNGWGHIAFSVGGGYVLCNDHVGNVRKIPMSYYSGMARPFWVYSTPAIYRHAFGRNPNSKAPAIAPKPAPAPTPVAKPLPAVSLTDLRYAVRHRKPYKMVPLVRQALGEKARWVKPGPGFKRSYAKWQRKLGYTGRNADGVPGSVSLKKLGAKSGLFRVVK